MSKIRLFLASSSFALASWLTGCAEGTVLATEESDTAVGGQGGGVATATIDTTSGGASSLTPTGAAEPVAPGDLVVSELMANPQNVSDASGEWIELYNASTGSVDLHGLVLRHEAGDPAAVHVIASSVVVPAGGYAVLGKDPDTATNGGIVLDYVYPSDMGLTNTGDYVAIERPDGTVVDDTWWSEPAPLGASRSLDPQYLSAVLNDDASHFCAASTPLPEGDRGTPGAPNDGCP